MLYKQECNGTIDQRANRAMKGYRKYQFNGLAMEPLNEFHEIAFLINCRFLILLPTMLGFPTEQKIRMIMDSRDLNQGPLGFSSALYQLSYTAVTNDRPRFTVYRANFWEGVGYAPLFFSARSETKFLKFDIIYRGKNFLF